MCAVCCCRSRAVGTTYLIEIEHFFTKSLKVYSKKKDEKHIFVPTFLHDSYFGLYILFLPLLVPI